MASFRLTRLYIAAAVVMMVGVHVGAHDPIADDRVPSVAVKIQRSNIAAAADRPALLMQQANIPASALVAVTVDSAQIDPAVDVAVGLPRRLMQWGRRGSRARSQARQMYWHTRNWGAPTIPSASRVETATERRFAMVGA